MTISMYEIKSNEDASVALWFESKLLTENKEYPRYIASIVRGAYDKRKGDYDVRGRISDMDGKTDFKEILYVGSMFSKVKENKSKYIRSIESAFSKYGIKVKIIPLRGDIMKKRRKGRTKVKSHKRRVKGKKPTKVKKHYRMVGKSDTKSGWRKSKKGKSYFENRRNRSDKGKYL